MYVTNLKIESPTARNEKIHEWSDANQHHTLDRTSQLL